MVIELANGGDGYIPPPEQHLLGGYNTWPARSAGLEVDAEPKIVAALLKRLEQVCESSRRTYHEPDGSASAALLRLQPTAYWRLGELSGLVAQDSGPARNHAHIEQGALFFLDGDPTFTLKADSLNQANRCMHLVESRLRWKPSVQTGDDQWGKHGFTTAFSFWNGLVLDSRPTAAWLFSCDADLTTTSTGLHVGIGGSERAGRLILQVGEEVLGEGRSDIPRWVWHRVAVVVFDGRIRVYLDNASVPQIDVATPRAFASLSSREFFWGGRSDKKDCLEGRLDEVVLLDHAADTRVLENLLLVPRP